MEDRMFRPFLSIVVLSALVVAAPSSAHAAQTRTGSQPSTKTALTSALNINTASAGDFEALPGIGAKTAALIVEYRQKNGPFKKIEDLMNVRGIGEKNFLKLKPQITVAAPKAERSNQPSH
jgi:competence protein ComEA